MTLSLTEAQLAVRAEQDAQLRRYWRGSLASATCECWPSCWVPSSGPVLLGRRGERVTPGRPQ